MADLGADGPPERADLVVQVGDTVVDLACGPLPDAAAGRRRRGLGDVRRAGTTARTAPGHRPLPRRATVPVDLADRVDVGTARVMFVNFAIQGLNDLFATPDDDYQPPRSYTRLTMRDEAASYSSRPGSEENSVGDGYAFTLDAHRRYGIPQMWAMNGGLATLLAHDCPDDLAAHARATCEAGLLVPVVAGLRRPPPALLHGRRRTSTPSASAPGSWSTCSARPGPSTTRTSGSPPRKDNVAGALRSAGMEYVVVDAGTGQGAVPDGAEETPGNTAIAARQAGDGGGRTTGAG